MIIAMQAGATDALSTAITSADLRQTAASGVASLVKDESWCVTPEATPGGNVYVAKVLMLLPKQDEQKAAETVVETTTTKGPKR